MKVNASCETCHFNHSGECRRYPPINISTESSTDYYLSDGRKIYETEHEPIWRFPEINNNDWCGEYKEEYQNETCY